MKIRGLDIGVESITRWRVDDEIHLPKEGSTGVFLPLYRPLDEILRRPSLDERLPALMQPESLDPDLLQPAILSAARQGVEAIFAQVAASETGRRRDLFAMAASYLHQDVEFDDHVRVALAELLKG